MRQVNYRILGLFSFIIFSWGLGWPANKVGLEYMSPHWYTAARMVTGTLTMLAFVMATGKLSLPRWQDVPLICIIGLLQISLYMLFANIGMSYLPAGRSSLIGYTTPLWIMPIAIVFFKEESSWLRWTGFGLGFSGLLVLLSPWEMDWTDGNVVFGSAMLLLASLCWAISILCARYMKWTKSPLELIPWQLLVGTIPVIIYAIIKEPVISVTWSTPLVLSLIYTGILVTGLSYWSGVIINRELPATVVSIGFLLVPVFSLTISAIFMHEAISVATISAMLMIMAGLICVVV